MREIRLSGSEGGAAQSNAPLLPLSQGMYSASETRVLGELAGIFTVRSTVTRTG